MTPAERPTGTANPAIRDGIAFVDDACLPIAEARIPLRDLGFLRSDPWRDTISLWNGKFFRLDDHLERVERFCTRLRMKGPHGRAALREIAVERMRRTGYRDAYLQFILTRGRMPIGGRDIRRAENRFQAFCIPYVWIANADLRSRGPHFAVSDIRRVPPQSVDPAVRHYHGLDFQMGLFDAYDRGADIVALTDLKGNVGEGPGFNVFAVRSGELLTPDSGVLDGMTRKTVFELALELNLRARLARVTPAELRGADEVFGSSPAGGVMPVRQVDDAVIGDGALGPTTRRLGSFTGRSAKRAGTAPRRGTTNSHTCHAAARAFIQTREIDA